MPSVTPIPAPRARLIVQRYPCTACVIINGLSMETLEKVALRRPDFTYKIVEVGDPSDLADVPGLEVEKLPALILDGVQRTAGSILAPRQLERMLDEVPVIRLAVVGGFLGAGKTTAILGLARRMLDQGLRIGIVTNDQGSNLVDTEVMRQNGLDVMEIAGGCFCCNFDQFSEKLAEMSRVHAPDVILAEPVGSCTDLVATVMKPLGQKSPGIPYLVLAPLAVVVDPRRLRRVMREQPSGPAVGPDFSDEINYLFRKQLEEAEIIALNKCDLTDADEIAVMTGWLERQFPGVTVLPVSATRGDGMDAWAAALGSVRRFGDRKSMEVAYDVYAAAEAELGWLNVRAEVTVAAGSDPDGNALLRRLLERIRTDIAADGQEIAHLKGYLVSGTDWAKMSCTGTEHPLVADHAMTAPFEHASLVLNLRAAADPERLQALVTAALGSVFGGAEQVRDVLMEAFRPSYPKPKNRMA